jgi:SAM-dependent methyltransferase
MIKALYKFLIPEITRIKILHKLRKLNSVFYFGNKFHCNCCNKSFSKFLNKGFENRPNAECPYCGSLERNRLLLFYLKNETKIFFEPLKVLHIAPEKCLFDIFDKLELEYIDGDINPALARYQIDLTNIQYADEYFDIIICSHVLGHIKDEERAIREMRRVIKKNGIALIITVLDLTSKVTIENTNFSTAEQKLKNYGEPDLCRLHGLDFSLRIENQGFKVETIDYRKIIEIKSSLNYSLGDGKRELIFKCEK